MDASAPPRGLNGRLSLVVKGFRMRAALRWLDGGRSVLDLGCGLCELVPRIPPGADYTGVERDPWMLDRARRLHPSLRFVAGDLEDPAFDPGVRADRLVLLAVWEHLRDPASFLARARGWTEPGGLLVLTTPAPRAHALLEAGSRVGLLSRHADEEHERLWPLDEIERAALAAGWQPTHRGTFLLGMNQLAVLRRPS